MMKKRKKKMIMKKMKKKMNKYIINNYYIFICFIEINIQINFNNLHDAVLLPPLVGHGADAPVLGRYHGAPVLSVSSAWTLALARLADSPVPDGLPRADGLLALLHEAAGPCVGTHARRAARTRAGQRPPVLAPQMAQGRLVPDHWHPGVSAHGSLVGIGISLDGSAPPPAHGQSGNHQRGTGVSPYHSRSAHHGSTVLWTGRDEGSLSGCPALVPIWECGLRDLSIRLRRIGSVLFHLRHSRAYLSQQRRNVYGAWGVVDFEPRAHHPGFHRRVEVLGARHQLPQGGGDDQRHPPPRLGRGASHDAASGHGRKDATHARHGDDEKPGAVPPWQSRRRDVPLSRGSRTATCPVAGAHDTGGRQAALLPLW